MWLNRVFARVLLIVGLLLSAVALGGKEARLFMMAAERAIEAPTDATGTRTKAIVSQGGGDSRR